MRSIAHVISTPEGIGGAERVMLALLREGTRRGWRQEVLNPFDIDPAGSVLGAEISALGDVGYRARSTRHLIELPKARRWLDRTLEGTNADIVHVHLFHALVMTASLRSDRPRILTHHHGAHFKASGRRLYGAVDRLAGKRMDRVVACSDWVRSFLVESYGYRNEFVTTIENGWEGTPLAKAGRAGQPPVLVCVANFREQKDHLTLLRAFELLVRAHPEARLRLVGDGPLKPEIVRSIREAGLEEKVDLVGAVRDVWSYLAAADVFVLTSTYEPLGIAVLEAMAARLPVVASDVGGLREIVEREVSGILVPPGDPAAFAEAIAGLLESESTREKMGLEGQKTAERWKMSVTVDRYFELYEQLLET